MVGPKKVCKLRSLLSLLSTAFPCDEQAKGLSVKDAIKLFEEKKGVVATEVEKVGCSRKHVTA
jgi:hypothetical protein